MDESGRASCHEVKDSLFTMECDLVAMAIGQKVDFTPLNDDLKRLPKKSRQNTTKERNNKNRSFFCVLMFFSH